MDEVYKLPKIAFPEVTGSTVSFYSEYAGLPLKKCEVAFAATQSGTGDPSPDNVRPIIGVNSVGVADSAADQEYYPVNKLIPIPAFQDGEGDPSPSNVRQILYGLSITRDDDSELEVYGGTLNVFSGELRVEWIKKVIDETSGVTRASNGILYLDDFFDISEDTLSVKCNCYTRGANKGTVANVISDNPNYSFCCKTGGTTQIRVMIKDTRFDTIEEYNEWLSTNPINILVKLETPEVIQLSATELQRAKEALGISTATIDLDGTRYGGTVDFMSGVMTVEYVKKVFDGTQEIQVANFRPANDSSAWVFKVIELPDFIPVGYGVVGDFKCDKLKVNTYNYVYSTDDGHGESVALFYNDTDGSVVMRISDTSLRTREAINNYLSNNNISIVYRLNTPIEVQLTPAQIETIQGNNTIFADTGDTTVQYIRVY